MPIVPMTGKPEDSLYPEPEEQKIEINPLSYLNTPDTATEAEFAVAVDELAKMSPFGIRETGDYSQFGADNAKDAFFNLRKATLHGIKSLSDDESRAWFETDPEDIETRYRIASENLPPSQRASLFAGEVVGGIDDMPILSEAEYKVAPPKVREASDRLKVQSGQATDVEAAWDRRPGRDKMRGDFPTITPGFASWDTPPPLPDDADFSGIISQWRDRYNKERTISAYSARIDAKNTLRKWAMMRPILSDDADSLLQHIMADKPRDDEFDAKFMALPEEQQEVVMMLGRDLRNTPDKNMLRDSMTEFMNGGMRLFGDAAKEVHDLWIMDETDREDFQKQAEVKARLQELWAPKRSQEYGYWEDAIIGTIGSLPYTGFTLATTMAGVPEVGLGVISLSMAHQFKRQVALQGGDVTDPKVLVMAQAAGIAYWGIEQAQVGTWMKSMTDLERRMATATFVKSLIPSIYKAEARARVRQVAPRLARDFTSDLLKEWLYEEQTQDLIESGFVSWGAGEDVARSMAEQAIESLHQNFGTMLLMTGGFSTIGAARTGLSRKHTDQELFDAMHHRAQLTGSLHQRNELREKVRKGEDIDRRQLAKLEKDIDYQRRVLSTFHRAFNKAGGMEDAESAFQRMGLDPRQSFLAAYMFDQERRSIMGDPDLTQAEKEELIGKQATSLSLLKQAYPNRTFTENPDGTFTSSYTINGNEVREIHQTGTLELDPASPEGATSTVNAINAAEKAARLSGAPFSDNMKGMTEERWLDLTPEARNEIVQALDLRPEGNFIFTAKMAGSPDVAQVDEKQIRHLSGEITLAPDADQTAAFHEDLHAFVRYLRETGDLTPQDVQKLREEFGDPRKGVNEDFNEEAAAETIRKMQSRSVRHIESTGAEAIMDKVFDALDRIDLFRRRRKQAETVAENLLGQMRRGEWAGIPVGTITEAQRQKNAQMRKKRRAKHEKQAKKPQEPTAKEPEQAQEPSEAEIQPDGQATEKPTSQAKITPQGEGQSAEEAAAAAEADEIGAGETGEVDADQPLGKGEWRAVTPKGNVYVRGEWVVVDMDDLKTSDQAGYDQSIQPRDRGTVRSRAQIHEIARTLNPAQLLDSARTDDGSPVMMPDGSVLSGNGRVIALREARDIGNIAKYQAVVRRRAAELGITIPAEIKNPVLVRRMDSIEGNSTVQQVAELSNVPVILQRSESEVAEADAKTIISNGLLRLFQPGADGNVLSASNMDFINGLVQATGDASLVDSNNRPTEATRNRIRRALLAMLVGKGENSREIVRGLVEDSKNLGMKTEVDGLMKAAADIVTVARDRPQYSLLNDIGLALRAYMDMKREGSSPFQSDLFGRPEAVDLIVKALWSRSSISSIASIFSDYATRARLVDTSTGGLGLDKDPTKEELLKAAIDATGTGETAEQAQQKKAEEAAAESPEPPPPPPSEEAPAPTTVAEDQSVDEIPPPSNITIQPGQTPWDQIGKGWKALNTRVKDKYTKWSKSIPLFQGAKRGMSGMTTKAIRSAMSKASRDAVRTIWDGFGGSGGWGLYHALENFENADLISVGEYYAPRLNKIIFFHTKGDKAAEIIQSPKFAELRQRTIGAMVSKTKAEDGQASLPDAEGQAGGQRALTSAGTLADRLKEIVEELYGPEMSEELTDLTAVLQAMADAAANGRQQAADTRSDMFDAIVDVVVRDAAEIRKAAQAFEARGGKIQYRTEPDTYKAIANGEVTPGRETFALIDPPYYLTQDYDPDNPGKIVGIDTYRQTRSAIKRLTEQGNGILYTDSAWWLDNADQAEAGLVVPEDHQIVVDILNGMDHLDVANREIGNRHEAIGVHHGRAVEQIGRGEGNGSAERILLGEDDGRLHQPGGTGSDPNANVPGMAEGTAGEDGSVRGGDGAVEGNQARLSASITPWTPEEGGRLYHGTAARDFGQFDGDIVYLAADPSETEPFAGMAEGSNRNVFTFRRARVIAVNASPGKIKNIDEAVADALMDDLDVEKHILAEANTARDEGFRYVSFSHPGIRSEREFDAIVSLYPKQDLKIDKERDIDGIQRDEQGDIARFSVSAKGLKALTTGVYKNGSAEVLADLTRLPASLKPYVAKYDDADELINLSGFAGWKPGPKVAPEHRAPYRPAVRLKDGRIAWHPRARMHSEALSMWLKQQDIPLDAFDIDEYYGDGGLGPDGRYYEKSYIGDGVYDFVEGRETGRFSVQARQPAPAMRDSVLYEGQARFSVKANAPSSTAQDAEYMAAVERGDMETAQRIVDEKWKASGFIGSPHGGSYDAAYNRIPKRRLPLHIKSMPIEFRKEILSWDVVSKSPYSDSFYSSSGITWEHKPPGVLRVADHWNFESRGELHCATDKDVKNNTHWTLAKYNNGIWEVIKSIQKEEGTYEGRRNFWTNDKQSMQLDSIADKRRDAYDKAVKLNAKKLLAANVGRIATIKKREWSRRGERYSLVSEENITGKVVKATPKTITIETEDGNIVTGKDFGFLDSPPKDVAGLALESTKYVIDKIGNIKLSDAITRDDAGRIIPPSERFNPQRDDIRYSVKAYPNLYRDVLSKHPASAKLDGNKAWLTLDGKWINVDEHRDAVPFDDGIYADIGVQEMAEAGLVRVHWVDFSSMPGGVMYAEHAPGQLTRAQRKELEDTAIERGGEVEYDPGQAWIRQPPPRYSVRARAPLFGNNNRAIASLAVQHLMGEKLDTERAEKAAYLFAASGTTPDQMIADAKKLAESKVAQQAKKHIENRDPNAAHQVMSQQAEYDSIVALRTGMKSGLKMGQEAERAKQSAEKKLLLNARGEDLQQFIIDTGIDWTETLLSSLPEAFAEWEKASKDAEEKAKAEGAPEGPQQEQEPPPADPAELEARDKRMREFVAAVRAWGDAERAKREKEADDRRKKEQERIEKGESGEEADDTDADPGGEQAEGMEPEGLVIPKELLQAHGVDIRNAQEVAHLIRIWMADWLVRQSKGRLTHQTVWKDREAVEKYRKTMVSQLRDMANGMVEQGWSMTVIHNRISDIPSTARPDTIERRTASIVAMIQAHSIRQTRAQLITDIRKNITKKAIKGKRHDALNEDLEGKINSEQELTARYLRRILTWSPEKVDAKIVAIQARLKERTELYSEQNPDAKVALDVEFHRDLMRLCVLKEWGGLKRMLPAQIKQAGIAIDGWLVSAQERLYRRWWAMEEQIGKLVTALNEGIVPDDPEQARIQVSRISGWINDNIATVRQRLEGLIRQQHDPIKRQAAQAAIDEIMFTLSRGTEIYRTVANAYRQAFVEAVNDIAGGKNAATAYMKHLEEEIPIEVAEQVSRQGYDGRGGGRVMTYNQALQLYASITQRGYASNVKLHKREEHAALLEGIFTTEDLALIVRLREIYEERRGRLSEVVQEVSGMLVWRPDPLYMPVRVKMPKKGGFQSKGDPSTWMPLARSLTPRVHHGLDFDEGATLTGTFYDATEDAARAIGFGTRGLILRGVLGNSTIQESADRYYGGGEMADMNQQVVQALDGFGRTDSDSTHGILRTIRELNAYAALSWNPMTALKQTVSFPVFAMALDGGFGQVLSAIKDFDREALRDIMESDGFKARYEGGFMPEVAEILSDGRRNPIARFYKLGMTTVQIGDFVPSLIVAPGLYKARLAQNIDAGMDEATAKERAMTWTWEMIEATQQTSRAEMLPKFYRQTGAGSEAMKLILQFSSAPLLQLSHEYHAWRDAMAGVDGAWKRLGRAVLVNHIIIPQMLEMVKKMFYWLIGRDEPEDQQLFWTIFNGATIGAVGRIMIIGILAETAYNAVVEGKIRYGGQMVPAESLTRTGAYAVRAFLHDPFDPEDGMDAFQSDIVKALEGMLAPFRYGKEFYDNRIAQ